jgi:hypothetical protein
MANDSAKTSCDHSALEYIRRFSTQGTTFAELGDYLKMLYPDEPAPSSSRRLGEACANRLRRQDKVYFVTYPTARGVVRKVFPEGEDLGSECGLCLQAEQVP